MIGQGFYLTSHASTDGRSGTRPSGELVPHLAQQRDEPLVKRHDVAAELLALCGQNAVDEVERAAAVEPKRRRATFLRRHATSSSR